MNDELTAALEPVLRDLARPDGVRMTVVDEPWITDPSVASAMLREPDGSRTGIQVTRGRPRPGQIAQVTDQVQEAAQEALWSLGRPTNWPPCPHHPRTHPMAVAERAGRAVWICPVHGDTIREIGS